MRANKKESTLLWVEKRKDQSGGVPDWSPR